MILYLDTSALVKAYVTEDGSAAVLAAMNKADAVATHLIAFVETNAAFARLFRERVLNEKQRDALKLEFARDWENYIQVGVDEALVRRASDLAEAFALRAYDGVHLAAADLLLKQSGVGVGFACFDRKLSRAAAVLGLPLAQEA
ncbi:MAG: type II toxin-antitoxin system VapC family toxin [Burkholderiales bacterium]